MHHFIFYMNWKPALSVYIFSGASMAFTNYKKDEPKGKPYLHMNFDSDFAWDTKDDANDKDNGFICKRAREEGMY